MDNIERINELKEIIKNDHQNFQAMREIAVLLLDNGLNEEALKYLINLNNVFKDDARF